MFNDFLTAILFFLPAGLANAIPVIVAKTPYLKEFTYPLDCYKTFRGQRILGDHKTMRGMISGILLGILTTFVLQTIYNNSELMRQNIYFDFANINALAFGFLSALGALLGDAIKSFFKRRSSIKPGDSWFPFDQIDYIIGGLLFLSIAYRLSLPIYIWVFISYFGLHLLSSYLGYLLKLKSKPI